MPRTIYVDVDDTLIRQFGSKRIPTTRVIQAVRECHERGDQLYCWSRAGATYAKDTAYELGISDCFVGFLTKPDIILDDEPLDKLVKIIVHPFNVEELHG